MDPAELVLRDIHLPPEPSWWPPAPGWWVLTLLLVLALVWLWRTLARARARQRRRIAIEAELSQALAPAEPSAQLALLSQLLRRAARHSDPRAVTLHGEDWLHFLDGSAPDQPFSRGPGRILLDGPFRGGIDHPHIAALLPILRTRYRQLLEPRP